MKRVLLLVAVIILAVAPRPSLAQERGATALGDELSGLGVTTRVLLIGAHPDDEDTQLIAWLAKGHHVETAYLSLTRGDGGQNLIGNELGPALGAIRTQELLAARGIDGGRQYFTRAYDFGFSKTAAETFKHWPRDSILEDMVTIVRAFRPQVIIAQWSGTPRDGHGHHQVAGILAREVYDASADTVRFPRARTGGLGPWQALEFYRSSRWNNAGATLAMNVGAYDPVLGRSYAELAAESRSQHESQGQGNVARPGARMDFLRLEASHVPGAVLADGGAPREGSVFDGLDTSLARFAPLRLAPGTRAALDSLPLALAAVHRSVDLMNPSRTVGPLATYLRLVDAARDGVDCRTVSYVATCDGALGDLATSLDTQHGRATRALLDAAGIDVRADAEREVVATGDSVPVDVQVFDQGAMPVELTGARVRTNYGMANRSRSATLAATIRPDSSASLVLPLHVDAVSMPWWLARPLDGDMFRLTAERASPAVNELAMGEDRVSFTTAEVDLRIAGVPVTAVVRPIVYRYADRARGERRRPVAGVPGIAVLLDRQVEYARAGAPFVRLMRVHVQSAFTTPRTATVSLTLPAGLAADSSARTIELPPFGAADVDFQVRGRLAAGAHAISAEARSGGEAFSTGYTLVEYPHIEPQRLYRPAVVDVEAVDTRLPSPLRVGYVPGVGDNVAPMLAELGVPLTLLDPAALSQTDLSRFTAIVVGPRAYGADPALVADNARLLQYVRAGGTLVVQYGQAEMGRPGIMPYPVAAPRTTDRVTEEDAPVRVTDAASPLLHGPNEIGPADFANWVQERTLYMPVQFDPRYHTLLSMNDTGYPPLETAIMVARYGRGTYVYTTLAFFRQLPAGNPGAARLFVNLLAAGNR